jgi:hypothetical protein
LHNIRRTTDEATREIPQYTQRITEYQEKTIQTIKDITSDVIEAEKQVVDSFQSHRDISYQRQEICLSNRTI